MNGEGTKILNSPGTAKISTKIHREDFAPEGMWTHAKGQNFEVSRWETIPQNP